MSWKKEVDADARPVWRGADSIVDQWHETALVRSWFVRAGSRVLLATSAFGSISLIGAAHEQWMRGTVHFPWPLLVLGALVAAAATVALFVFTNWCEPDLFIVRKWRLTATANGFAYRAGQFSAPLDPYQVSRDGTRWTVALDAVSRVEASTTTDWQRVRRYEGKPMDSRDGVAKIPEMEFQVFFFMEDGSRRVIQTVNADPESAATLAHSIRSLIEARRNAPSLSFVSKSSSPRVAASMEGFEI